MDTATCPLCGEANHCAMAADSADDTVSCWCKAVVFPQQLLNRVPDTAKNRCCICSNCLTSHMKTGD